MLIGTQEKAEGKKVQALQHLKILSYFVQYFKRYLHSTLTIGGIIVPSNCRTSFDKFATENNVG